MSSLVGMRGTSSTVLMPAIAIPVTISPSPVSSIISFTPIIPSSVIALTVTSWTVVPSIAVVCGMTVSCYMRFSMGASILPISRLRIARPLPMFSVSEAVVGTL